MPITSNVAWDTRLETFKGRDTAQYIATVMAMASRCAACRLPQSAGFDSDLTTPSLVFGAPGGEMTSALVSALLSHGFQMSLTGSYGDIVRRCVPARDTCTCSVSDGGAIALHVDGELMHSQQLDQTDVGDALWLEGTTAGHVLVISGDNLVFTETGLELGVAARLGTLVTGIVPVIA